MNTIKYVDKLGLKRYKDVKKLLKNHTNEEIVQKYLFTLDLNDVICIREAETPFNSPNLNYKRIINNLQSLMSINFSFNSWSNPNTGQTYNWIKIINSKEKIYDEIITPAILNYNPRIDYFIKHSKRRPIITIVEGNCGNARIKLYNKKGKNINTYTVLNRELLLRTESKLIDRLIKEINIEYG